MYRRKLKYDASYVWESETHIRERADRALGLLANCGKKGGAG